MRSFLLATSIPLVATIALGQPIWKPDKAHSSVKFTVSHMVISEVEGRFTDFDATVTAAKDDWSDMQIDAVVKTASLNTDNEFRDKHLRSDDFFNTEKFPEAKFHSTGVEVTGKDTYRITGDLTIRDVTREVVLDTRFKGTAKDPRGTTKAAFRATTTIDRFDWGMKWNKAIETGGLVAGNEVTLTLIFELAKQ
jgi:polyisoprenoid-binding protein YceI